MRTIRDLRERLFDAIDKVSDGTMDLDRAQKVADLAQVIVNSAKAEVEHMKVAETAGTGFIPLARAQETLEVKHDGSVVAATGRFIAGRSQSGGA